MMKNVRFNWLLAALPLLLVAGTAFYQGSQQDGPIVAYVNTATIMQQTPGYAAAESTFARELAGYQDEIGRMQSEIDSAIAEFNRASVALSPTARQERESQIQQMSQQHQARMEQLRVQAQRRERELVAPLEERVSAIIDGVRAERSIGIVFDVANDAGVIVSADRALDLTPLVVQRLRAAAPTGQTQPQN